MKATLLLAGLVAVSILWILVGCGAEYPAARDERYVFTAKPVKALAGTNAAAEALPFIGQVISISGKITHIKNSGGQPAIQIDDVVVCAFGSRFRRSISELHVGDTVCLKGLVDSVNRAGVYMTPCVFVDAASN